MKAFAVRRGEEHPDLAGAVLCQDVPGLFRKGHALRAEDVAPLMNASWSELHLLRLEADDIPQREAGRRLAELLLAPGLEAAPAGHRHVLRAEHEGLLKVDVEALRRLNDVRGIAVFTLRGDAVVAAGEIVAEAQIAPLAIGREELEEAEAIGPILRLLKFRAREAVLLACDDRAVRGLSAKLARFGCALRQVVPLPADAASIRAALEARAEPLAVVCGSNALDPLDPVFVALEAMGATMQRRGMPVHPGTLLWIATWKERTIIGLPSCGFASQLTAFDLVLPRLLAGDAIDYAELGHGGILTAAVRQATSA